MKIFHNTFIRVRKYVANPYPLYSCHCHDITEILLKVALNTINPPTPLFMPSYNRNA
jgi:hypothetical protein